MEGTDAASVASSATATEATTATPASPAPSNTAATSPPSTSPTAAPGVYDTHTQRGGTPKPLAAYKFHAGNNFLSSPRHRNLSRGPKFLTATIMAGPQDLTCSVAPQLSVNCLIDTASVNSKIPKDLVEHLGLEIQTQHGDDVVKVVLTCAQVTGGWYHFALYMQIDEQVTQIRIGYNLFNHPWFKCLEREAIVFRGKKGFSRMTARRRRSNNHFLFTQEAQYLRCVFRLRGEGKLQCDSFSFKL